MADKLDAPQNLTMKECTESSVTLAWEEPESDNGSPISRYVVERRETSKRAWAPAGNTPADRQVSTGQIIIIISVIVFYNSSADRVLK